MNKYLELARDLKKQKNNKLTVLQIKDGKETEGIVDPRKNRDRPDDSSANLS